MTPQLTRGRPRTRPLNPMDGLPSVSRWTALRKTYLVDLVNAGRVTAEQVCERYGVTPDEFLSWSEGVRRFGVEGVKFATRSRRRRIG